MKPSRRSLDATSLGGAVGCEGCAFSMRAMPLACRMRQPVSCTIRSRAKRLAISTSTQPHAVAGDAGEHVEKARLGSAPLTEAS
jgi:hypothetical protein